MNPKLATVLKILAPIAVLLVGGLGAARLASRPTTPEIRPADVPPPLVRVIEVRPGSFQLTVTSQGTVSPRTESRVVPEIAGRVVWVSPNFVSGGFFEHAEPLVRIDRHDYEQSAIRAQADVAAAALRLAEEEAEAEIAIAEWAQLGQGEAPPLTRREPHLANARAALAAAEANLQRTRKDLDRTEILSPYAGRVREKNADVGQFVTAGTSLGSIYAIDFAEIRLPLPDGDLAFVDLPLVYRGEGPRRGPRVTLRTDFAGGVWEWSGRIVRTEGEIDRASRMVHAVARVANPYGRGNEPARPPLAAGMYVNAEIEGRLLENVIALPRSVIRADGRLLVVDDDDRLELRDVSVVRADRDRVVIDAGLAAGERVCLTNLDVVTNGMRVRVADASATAEPAGIG